jgi:hypothetical protein
MKSDAWTAQLPEEGAGGGADLARLSFVLMAIAFFLGKWTPNGFTYVEFESIYFGIVFC